MLCFKANDEDVNTDDFPLDFEEPQKNNGMLLYRNDVVIAGKEIVECASIMKPICDMRDAKNKLITATLLADGSGIRVREPSVPSYLLEGPHGDCSLSQIAHKVVSKKIKKKDGNRQFKTQILRFPEGMTCNKSHFNKRGTPLLDNNVDFKDVILIKGKEDPDDKIKVSFFTWKVAVDGTNRAFDESDDDDDDDDEWNAALSKHKKDQNKAASKAAMDLDGDEDDD